MALFKGTPQNMNINADSSVPSVGSVLILEDEILMSALLERYIQNLSSTGRYGVLEPVVFHSGLDLLNQDLSHYRVAVVDILLPQITGLDLIRDFKGRFPQMGLVPISGMATITMQRTLKEILPAGTELLAKPLHKEAFNQAFDKAWLNSFNQQLQPRPSHPLKEGEEELWTAGKSLNTLEIPTLHRKLLRKKTGTDS